MHGLISMYGDSNLKVEMMLLTDAAIWIWGSDKASEKHRALLAAHVKQSIRSIVLLAARVYTKSLEAWHCWQHMTTL